MDVDLGMFAAAASAWLNFTSVTVEGAIRRHDRDGQQSAHPMLDTMLSSPPSPAAFGELPTATARAM